ncbi:MAG: NifU family protein [Caedibacter sp. 37-49]|nr:MAG: NifU family protein [Caedibacter sp. 37-49]
MFIQTEETPNPATLKFLPGRPVLESGTADFPTKESADECLLAKTLFTIKGISGVFFGSDFITLTKLDQYDWLVLKPKILGFIMEYFMHHEKVEIQLETTSVSSEEDSDVVKEIKEILDGRIRPAVAMDGGDIVFNRFENGIVYLEMQGACSGCPSSTATLKTGIENMLKHYIPEVQEVRATNE